MYECDFGRVIYSFRQEGLKDYSTMFWDDIVLVSEQISKYGLRTPFADLGGQERPCIADYSITIKSGDQHARYLQLAGKPFDHIDPSYVIINPELGHPPIEELPKLYTEKFGTAVCLNVIEHIENPFEVFDALYKIMLPGGLLIVSTVFSFPNHPSPRDYWRYSPDCLRYLASKSGFNILECDWRLEIRADRGVLEITKGAPQEIVSVYITLAKGSFTPMPRAPFMLPKRLSDNPIAQGIIDEEDRQKKLKREEPILDLVGTSMMQEVQPRMLLNERSCMTPSNISAVIGLGKPKCLFVNFYYPAFLDSHYRNISSLGTASYQEQLSSLLQQCFGDSDFYSKALQSAGWETADLIANCQVLQDAWAHENNCSQQGLGIVVEQVRQFRPDVLYVQDINALGLDFFQAIKGSVKLIVGQNACPLSANVPFEVYDILFSSFPHFVDQFRAIGKTSYYQPLAFDSRVLERIEVLPIASRPIQCSFVGSVSSSHRNRLQFLNHVATRVPLEIWGVGIDELSADSSLRQRYRGQAWGLDMFTVLASSKITINNHIDAASRFSNNMRLFEATGCGALLITDYKDNLNELFQIGKEVVAYRSAEECCALVQYYLSHLDEAEEIARAGQARTLAEHSYNRRMAHSAEVLNRHILYCSTNWQKPDLDRVSSNYVPLGSEMVTSTLADSWQDQSIPEKQRNLVQAELGAMYSGQVPIVFKVLTQALQPYLGNGTKLLEVGCSSGYYYEIIEYLLNKRINYTGVDYSEAMIEMARDYYPRARFHVADGARMPFVDREFEVAISSGILLHVPNYRDHIRETVRVAQKYIVAHRTPVRERGPTQFFTKRAYGVDTVELRFNEGELLECFAGNNCNLINKLPIDIDHAQDNYCVTYVFEKDLA